MVFEPFTALGLASNILQIVDFSWKIVSNSIAVYQSVDGATEENASLEGLTTRLKGLSESLLTPTATAISDSERGLQVLAAECHSISQELIDLLEHLRLKRPHSKWESFKVAVRELRKGDQVQVLSDKLGRIQTQLGLYLLKTLSDKQSDVFKEIEKLKYECRQFGSTQASKLQELHDGLLNELRRLAPSAALSKSDVQALHNALQASQPVFATDIDMLSKRIHNLSASLSAFVTDGRSISRETRLLRSLSFKTIRQRHDDIPVAHRETFRWILNPDSIHSARPIYFHRWLERGSGVFWVAGKAGSGKSTLMRFITDCAETRSTLENWAGSKTLAVAKYFFWSAGDRLQKTLDGLLRTLLLDILLACRELISLLDLDVSATDEHLDYLSWSREKLVSSIKLAITQENIPVRFCFFIDGLDEYGGNECDTLVDLIRDLAQYDSVKLCVSSRPWNEFKRAFGTDTECFLRLEHLTEGDIRAYVQNTFEQNAEYQEVKAHDNRYPHLIQEIVERANGVFLWVYLVVRSLLKGLTNADRIVDLECRLRALPPTLEAFFQRMLDSVEEVYKTQTARTIMIALDTELPLSLMTYSFLDEDKDFALSAQMRTLGTSEVKVRQSQMKKRINGRTKGILEVKRVSNSDQLDVYHHYHVDFLHRTARDFVMKSSELRLSLGVPEETEIENSIRLMYAFLAELKLGPRTDESYQWISTSLENILYCAYKAESATKTPQIAALDECERVIDETTVGKYWANGSAGYIKDAVGMGLIHYVRHRASRTPETIYANSTTYLANALNVYGRSARLPKLTGVSINPDLVRLMLEYNADPNRKYYSGSYDSERPWVSFLRRVYYDKVEVATQSEVFVLTEMLIEHGANLNVLCEFEDTSVYPHGKFARTATQVLEEKFSPAEVRALFAKVPPKPEPLPAPKPSFFGRFRSHPGRRKGKT